jgi:hypothetical protein
VDGGQPCGLVWPGGVVGAGGELATADGGVQGDDVLGVDEPGGTRSHAAYSTPPAPGPPPPVTARSRRPAAATTDSSAPVPARITTSSPGRENAVMACAACGPGAGVAGQTLSGSPIPGALAAGPGCCPPVSAGQGTASGAGSWPA